MTRFSSSESRRSIMLAGTLALVLAVLAGVVGPPSEFAPRASRWWALDPLMFPLLFAGVILAFIAFIAACIDSGIRKAATLCVSASLSTAIGLVIAAGISDRKALTFYAEFVGMVAIPAIVAIAVLTRGRHA